MQRELVPRTRLIERLNQGRESKVILVSTPAGYGKTMLLSAWAAQCGFPVTWISLDEGKAVAPLLQESVRGGTAVRGRTVAQYAARLLAALEAEAQPAAGEGLPPVKHGDLVEPLTGREIELLVLIAAGLSNQEISQRLFISLPTVKWHIGNIFGKLGVRSRTQAVAQARALGILPWVPCS